MADKSSTSSSGVQGTPRPIEDLQILPTRGLPAEYGVRPGVADLFIVTSGGRENARASSIGSDNHTSSHQISVNGSDNHTSSHQISVNATFEDDGTSGNDSTFVRRDAACLDKVTCGISLILFFPLGIAATHYLILAQRSFNKGNRRVAVAQLNFSRILATISVLFGVVWIGILIGLLQ